ncbi:MAG: hypothetical protein ACREDR_41570 [Blastocatellia bacterium]
MQVELSQTERDLLVKIVDQYYSTLREEIYKTEGHGIKTELKAEESTVKSLLARLQRLTAIV